MSTVDNHPIELGEPGGQGSPPERRPSLPTSFLRTVGLDRFSGVYAWIVLIVIFGLWLPSTFLTVGTARTISASQAVTAIAAMGLILPLTAGLFDLSVAANLGAVSVLTLKLQGEGVDLVPTIVLCLALGALIGAANGFLVVKVGVNSFIATLGMSSILAALAYEISNGNQLVGNPTSNLVTFGQGMSLGVPNVVWCALGVAAILWYLTEWTGVGRYMYGIGDNIEASRLVGIRVGRIQFGTMLGSGLLAGAAGILLAGRLGAADPAIGPPYLLPAFSAVLLGATQIKTNGRVNVIGTLVAVALLATGIYGLQLAGAPSYVSDLFNGVALIVAVSLSVRANRQR